MFLLRFLRQEIVTEFQAESHFLFYTKRLETSRNVSGEVGDNAKCVRHSDGYNNTISRLSAHAVA
jgi:hypothetical protein